MKYLPKSPLQWHSLTLNNFCHSYFVFKRGSTEGSFFFQNPIKLLTFKVSGLIFGHFFLHGKKFNGCWTVFIMRNNLFLPRTRSICIHPRCTRSTCITTGADAHNACCFLHAGVAYVKACSGKRRHGSHPDGKRGSLTHHMDTLKLRLW